MIAISAAAGYELWAETWDSTPSPIVALEERILLPWIETLRLGKVLDVGCGTGRWTARLGALGMDASPAMLRVASGKPGLAGRLAAADATALPVAPARFDTAVCALTLGHVRDQSAAMQELARVLRPGGTLLLTDFHPAAFAHGWRRTFRHGAEVYDLEHYPYSPDELHAPGLALRRFEEAGVGEPERGLFERAGKPELFDAATQVPVVLLSMWTRV
jgi:SAM-dependent methyltransferase